ncbi:MAG: hypothetical protein WEB59_05465 [Thermoanaerobaculia bacterium]
MATKGLSRKDGTRRVAVRVLLGSLGVAVVLFVGYLAGARWLLSGPKLRSWINTDPVAMRIDYDEAVSPWPGRLKLKNLQIRGSDDNVQWVIVLAQAKVDYSVFALFRKTFRPVWVRGSGLSFRLRNKLAPRKLDERVLELLPPIPGFSDPPLRAASPSPPAEPGRPWSIDVRNIRVEKFDEIWIDVYRYRGSARLDGRFFLRPGLLARVGPATIDIPGGDVRLGEDPILLGATGRIAATMDAWDPREVQGSEVWKNTSGEVKLQGRTESLKFLNFFARASAEPHFSGGPGALSIALSVEKGSARGDVALTAGRLGVRAAGVSLTGDAALRLHIAGWEVERGPMDVDRGRLELTEVSAAGAARSRGWWGRFDLTSTRIDSGFRGQIAIRCRDARPLLPIFGVPLPKWTHGIFDLEDLEARAAVVLGSAATSVRGLEATGGPFAIRGEYERRGKRTEGVFLIRTKALSVGVEIRENGTGLRLIGPTDWFEARRAAMRGTASPARTR